jgi:hypothetical protein
MTDEQSIFSEAKFIASFPPEHRYSMNLSIGGSAKIMLLTSADQFEKLIPIIKMGSVPLEVIIRARTDMK